MYCMKSGSFFSRSLFKSRPFTYFLYNYIDSEDSLLMVQCTHTCLSIATWKRKYMNSTFPFHKGLKAYFDLPSIYNQPTHPSLYMFYILLFLYYPRPPKILIIDSGQLILSHEHSIVIMVVIYQTLEWLLSKILRQLLTLFN